MRVKYIQEKKDLKLENKFKQLITSREAEWENAWSKRDENLKEKERQIVELEACITEMKDVIGRKELEIQAAQT